jgi:molybdate transport system substrate-binding protein
MRLGVKFATACILAVLSSAASGATLAADLVVLTNQGAAPTVRALSAAFSRQSGNNVTVLQVEGAELERRLTDGTADVMTANPQVMGDLVMNGRVVAATAAPFMSAGLGLSVRAGAPKPNISTVESYRAALLAAKSVGYSRGCSGTNVGEGIAQLGIAEQLAGKTTRTENGPVTDYLARGEIEVGIQQTNIMVGVAGSDYVGPLPGNMNKPCVFNAAVITASRQQDAARALMRYMVSPAAAPVLRATYTEPPAP